MKSKKIVVKITEVAFIFLAAMGLSLKSFATENSFEKRHLAKITKAIAEKCHLSGDLKLTKNEIEEIKIDQGLVDYIYYSDFTLDTQGLNSEEKTFIIFVKSTLNSSYNHEDKNWGVYTVETVSCIEI